MNTIKWVLRMVTLMGLLGEAAPALAHVTGSGDDGGACSPHGQNTSSTGCVFGVGNVGCLHTTGNNDWYRDFECGSESTGSLGCSCGSGYYACGYASIAVFGSGPNDHGVDVTSCWCTENGTGCW
jgi:hypothetical protein